MVLPADTVSDLLHEKQIKNKMSCPSHSKDVSAASLLLHSFCVSLNESEEHSLFCKGTFILWRYIKIAFYFTLKICCTLSNTIAVSVPRWDPRAVTFFFFLIIFFVAVKSEFKFVTYAVLLSQRGIKCGKADTIKDYTGGGAHTCVSKHGLISISLSREPAGC